MPSMPKDLSTYLPPALGFAAKGLAGLNLMGCSAPSTYAPEGPTPDDIVWKKGQNACVVKGMAVIPVQFTEDVPRKRLATTVIRTDTGEKMNVATDNLVESGYCSVGPKTGLPPP